MTSKKQVRAAPDHSKKEERAYIIDAKNQCIATSGKENLKMKGKATGAWEKGTTVIGCKCRHVFYLIMCAGY